MHYARHVAALEDKIVQRATAAILNQIYEEEFLGFSYGFRPKRSQHDALDALMTGIGGMKVSWIIDADIQGFFDAVRREWLHRSHVVLSLWLRRESDRHLGGRWRRREATGNMIITRYADDIVVGFERETDASRFLDMMRVRFEAFAPTLHSEKTRLIEFGRFAAHNRARRGLGKPETFNFLGFTLICSISRRGKFLLKRKSRSDRMRAKLRETEEELRRRRHLSIPEQGQWLRQVVMGFFAYHAVPTNIEALAAFRNHVRRLWWRSLSRRSQRDETTWERCAKIADEWLPKPKIFHPWPSDRFAVKHPRWEPYAGKPHVQICARGAQ